MHQKYLKDIFNLSGYFDFNKIIIWLYRNKEH